MKKILSMLLVLVTMLTVCTSLVACGGPKPTLNLDKAKRNLKDNDYEVEIMDGDDWEDVEDGALAIEEVLYAEEEDGDNYIYIIKFKTTKDAKLYYKAEEDGSAWVKFLKYVLKKYGDDLDREDRDEIEEEIEDWTWGCSGKYVWYGTKDAVKDTKG